MKTRLFLFICLSALALHGFTTALAGEVDLPLSSKNPTGTRVMTVGQAIESNIYPKDSNKPYAEKADPDRDVSTIQNHAQAYLDRFLVDNCQGMPPRELASCRNAIQAPTITPARFDQAQVKIKPATTLVDDCLGMPPRELANCRNPIQAPIVAPARFDQAQGEIKPATTLVEAVRQSTVRFKNVDEAQAAGYSLFHGCVSGPQEGAMGVHFVNGDLVGDGALDPMRPEALLYEFKNGQMQLSGVEYVVIAEAWHANNEVPPVLMGQLLNYVGSPNRYGIPAFYELHVWAWNPNPLGTFVDWNPKVSCDSYTAEVAPHGASH